GLIAITLDLFTPLLVQRMVDIGIPSHEPRQILTYAAIWAALSFGSIVFDAIQIGATNICGEKVIVDLRMAVFQHMQRLSMSFYEKTKLGKIITRGTSDMDALRTPVVSGINTMAFNVVLMIGSAGMIFATDWRLFLAVAWLAPVLALTNHAYRLKIGAAWQ